MLCNSVYPGSVYPGCVYPGTLAVSMHVPAYTPAENACVHHTASPTPLRCCPGTCTAPYTLLHTPRQLVVLLPLGETTAAVGNWASVDKLVRHGALSGAARHARV